MRRIIAGLCAVALGISVAFGLARLRAGTSADIRRTITEGVIHPTLVTKLRAEGPSALDRLFELREQLQSTANDEQDPSRKSELNEQIERLNDLIDEVGMQRYCSRSRLYWYTDLEDAKRAAKASGKPILSLRLLGKLNEDFSCANSRFFRTTLYANEEISAFLRDHFILHWRSVRPVPKVTIDFGDGRKLERTLTGNSIHYLLTADGDVVDALPGLYGPKAFLQHVSSGLELARRATELASAKRNQVLADFHQEQFDNLTSQWQSDLAVVDGRPELQAVKGEYVTSDALTANEATRIAMPKLRVEAAPVRSALPLVADPTQVADQNLWQAIALLHADNSRLDGASRDIIRREHPTAAQAAPVAETKRIVESPLVRMVQSLESSIALDTVRNEYRLHREIHRWLSNASDQPDVESLNERAYAELFLTPSSDPWLGLAPADVYTALPNAGVVAKAK